MATRRTISGNIVRGATLPVGAINATGTPGAGNYLRGDGAWEPTFTPQYGYQPDEVIYYYAGGPVCVCAPINVEQPTPNGTQWEWQAVLVNIGDPDPGDTDFLGPDGTSAATDIWGGPVLMSNWYGVPAITTGKILWVRCRAQGDYSQGTTPPDPSFWVTNNITYAAPSGGFTPGSVVAPTLRLLNSTWDASGNMYLDVEADYSTGDYNGAAVQHDFASSPDGSTWTQETVQGSRWQAESFASGTLYLRARSYSLGSSTPSGWVYWGGGGSPGVGTGYVGSPYSGGGGPTENYFGTGADGAVTYSADTSLASSTGVDDTGIVVKNYLSLTINSGVVVEAAERAQVMLIYVTGDCTINGTLSMDALGAAATATFPIQLIRNGLAGILPSPDNKSSITFVVPATGAAGGVGGVTGLNTPGSPGSAGAAGQTGGGGGGAGGSDVSGVSFGNGGNGVAGTAFCGGSGGGAGGYASGGPQNGIAAAANGGAGGNSGSNSGNTAASGGGAGNPVGSGSPGSGGSVIAPSGGGGGTIILVVGGTFTMGSSGLISANGGAGGNANAAGTSDALGGGGAGGGAVIALYYVLGNTVSTTTASGITMTNGAVIRALGGTGGTATGGTRSNVAGGDGGAGSVQFSQISNP